MKLKSGSLALPLADAGSAAANVEFTGNFGAQRKRFPVKRFVRFSFRHTCSANSPRTYCGIHECY
jgi:hypothetical protein